MMVAVAVVGLLIGGRLELVRLGELSDWYAGRAINARRRLSRAQRFTGWTHERWLAECRETDRGPYSSGGTYTLPQPIRPDLARKYVAYWGPIVSKYERAARYPWLPVAPDPPEPK